MPLHPPFTDVDLHDRPFGSAAEGRVQAHEGEGWSLSAEQAEGLLADQGDTAPLAATELIELLREPE